MILGSPGTLSKILAALLVGMACYGLIYPAVGARVVLAFLPPSGLARLRAASEDPDRALAEWATPCDLARLLLESPAVTNGVCQYLESQPDPQRQKGLRDAFALLEEKRLLVDSLGPSLLQLEVLDADPKMARLYCQGVLKYLEQALREERRTKHVNSQVESDLVQSQEKLALQEAKLTASVETSGPRSVRGADDVAVQYALSHYSEALEAHSLAVQRRLDWNASIQANAPQFAVLAGPSAFRRFYWPGIGISAGLALLLLVLPAGLRNLRPGK